ncbi:hypothetical protein ACQEU8_03935 [Streptomyces sp. CA-250714]|uniref:hypothetical protein n=1 Tax=Streptomyces sp. CA-250714 TaxID=3240060 RepID=UPI003D8ED260
MPNPTPDDLTLSRAYLLWVNPPEPAEDRWGTLPDRDVEITVPAMWPYPEQLVKLGEELHSFLNPANPGAGPKLVVALGTGDVPVDDVKGLGWHIHPGILNDDQLAKWATPDDRKNADMIYQLFEEGRAITGHLPAKILKDKNEKRKHREPDWSLEIRRRMYFNKVGEGDEKGFLGPAAAWALIDNDIPVVRDSRREGLVQISPAVPLESEKAARERGEEHGRNIRAFYDWRIVPRGYTPSSNTRSKDNLPAWAKQTVNRLADLAKTGSQSAASTAPEIAALEEAGGLTLVPNESHTGFRVSTKSRKTWPITAIIDAVNRLPTELREFGPGSAQQQNQLGGAQSARQPGASYGQPGAQHTLPPQPRPEVPTWAGAGAFAPPSAGGHQPPSSTTPAMPPGGAPVPRPQSRQGPK